VLSFFLLCVATAEQGPWPASLLRFLDHTQLGLICTIDQLVPEAAT